MSLDASYLPTDIMSKYDDERNFAVCAYVFPYLSMRGRRRKWRRKNKRVLDDENEKMNVDGGGGDLEIAEEWRKRKRRERKKWRRENRKKYKANWRRIIRRSKWETRKRKKKRRSMGQCRRNVKMK